MDPIAKLCGACAWRLLCKRKWIHNPEDIFSNLVCVHFSRDMSLSERWGKDEPPEENLEKEEKPEDPKEALRRRRYYVVY